MRVFTWFCSSAIFLTDTKDVDNNNDYKNKNNTKRDDDKV